MQINVTIDDSQVRGDIARIQKGLSLLTEPLLKAKQLVLDEKDKQFSSKGSNFGTPWPSRKIAVSWPMLNKTGRMKKGFSWAPFRPTDMIEIKNEVPYYKYHQGGTSKMPQRKMLHLSPNLVKQIDQVFQTYIKKLLK